MDFVIKFRIFPEKSAKEDVSISVEVEVFTSKSDVMIHDMMMSAWRVAACCHMFQDSQLCLSRRSLTF